MTHLPEEVFKALGRLISNSDFEVLMKWFEEEREKSIGDLLADVNLARLHQHQGKAQWLVDFLRIARSAKPALPRA